MKPTEVHVHQDGQPLSFKIEGWPRALGALEYGFFFGIGLTTGISAMLFAGLLLVKLIGPLS